MRFTKNILKNLYILFKETFIVASIFVFFLFVLEELQFGFVSFWLDFKLIFIILFIIGALALLFSEFAKTK